MNEYVREVKLAHENLIASLEKVHYVFKERLSEIHEVFHKEPQAAIEHDPEIPMKKKIDWNG